MTHKKQRTPAPMTKEAASRIQSHADRPHLEDFASRAQSAADRAQSAADRAPPPIAANKPDARRPVNRRPVTRRPA